MKILILSTEDQRGGAAQVAFGMGQKYIEEGHEVLMYVKNKTSEAQWVKESDSNKLLSNARHLLDILPGAILTLNPRVQYYLGYFGQSLDKVIKEFKPDAIHVHWTGKAFVSIREIERVSKEIPVVWTLHDWGVFSEGTYNSSHLIPGPPMSRVTPKLPLVGKLSHNYRRSILRGSTIKFTTPSKFLGNFASKSGTLNPHNVSHVPNPYDERMLITENKTESREKLGLELEGKYILVNGLKIKSNPIKGFDLFLESIKSIEGELAKFGVQIISVGGEDPFRHQNLKVQSKHLGYISDRKEMARIYNAVDLLCLPSRLENLPLVSIEAGLQGTPVVAFEVGGIPETVLLKELLVTPYDTNEYAKKILEGLEGKHDSSKIVDFIRKTYDPQAIVNHLLESLGQ